ncbi:MAG: hypothetical protein HY755_12950 [Nitrospirae bacterium]|nr:hypothetical protein [Nitrospirota bacterium]
MEEIDELIKQYGLEEDTEHVIIPLPGKDGHIRRCYLLKRRFIRIAYPEGYFIDYPLTKIIEATIKYPDFPLTESLYLLQKTMDAETRNILDNEKEEDKN